MKVSEAAMNENDFTARSKDQIGLAWKVLGVEPIPVAEGEDEFAHQDFCARVLRANPCHDFRAFRRGKSVHTL